MLSFYSRTLSFRLVSGFQHLFMGFYYLTLTGKNNVTPRLIIILNIIFVSFLFYFFFINSPQFFPVLPRLPSNTHNLLSLSMSTIWSSLLFFSRSGSVEHQVNKITLSFSLHILYNDNSMVPLSKTTLYYLSYEILAQMWGVFPCVNIRQWPEP